MAGELFQTNTKLWKYTFESRPLGITVWKDENGATFLKKIKDQNVLGAGVTPNMYIVSINSKNVRTYSFEDIKKVLIHQPTPLHVTFSLTPPSRSDAQTWRRPHQPPAQQPFPSGPPGLSAPINTKRSPKKAPKHSQSHVTPTVPLPTSSAAPVTFKVAKIRAGKAAKTDGTSKSSSNNFPFSASEQGGSPTSVSNSAHGRTGGTPRNSKSRNSASMKDLFPRYRVTDKGGVICRRFPDIEDNSGACPIIPVGAILEVVQINDEWIKLRNGYWLHMNFDGIEPIADSDSSVSVSVDLDSNAPMASPLSARPLPPEHQNDARLLTQDQQLQLAHLQVPPGQAQLRHDSISTNGSNGYSQNNSPEPTAYSHQPYSAGATVQSPYSTATGSAGSPGCNIANCAMPQLTRSMTEEVVSLAEGEPADLRFLKHRQDILQAFRPCLRCLLSHLVKYSFEWQGRTIHPYFRTYVYGGEAYMLYWEAENAGETGGGERPLPFRRPLDVDVYVPIDVQDWTEPQRLERKQELFVQDIWRIWDRADVRSLADIAKIKLNEQGHHLQGPYMSTAVSAVFYQDVAASLPSQQPGHNWSRTGTPPIDNEKMYRKVCIEYYDGSDPRPVVLCDFQLKPRVSWGSWEDVYTMTLDRRSLGVVRMTPGDLPETSTTNIATIRVPNVRSMMEMVRKVVRGVTLRETKINAPENRRRNPRFESSRKMGMLGGTDTIESVEITFKPENIGITYRDDRESGACFVSKVSTNFPAAKSGVQVGWWILEVDNEQVPRSADSPTTWVLAKMQEKQAPYKIKFLPPISMKPEVPIKAITDLSRRDWFIESFVKSHAPQLYNPDEVSDLEKMSAMWKKGVHKMHISQPTSGQGVTVGENDTLLI